MVDTLGITRDLGADHASGVGVVFGATHPPDPVGTQNLDLQSAGRWAIVWTDTVAKGRVCCGVIHGVRLSGLPAEQWQNSRGCHIVLTTCREHALLRRGFVWRNIPEAGRQAAGDPERVDTVITTHRRYRFRCRHRSPECGWDRCRPSGTDSAGRQPGTVCLPDARHAPISR